MNIKNLIYYPATIFGVLLGFASSTLAQDSQGNRYFLERFYKGEISAAQAYLENSNGLSSDKDASKKVYLLDVRDASEYKLNHPRKAYHFPYPRIYRECVNNARTEDGACSNGTVYSVAQDPEQLFLQVERLVKSKDDKVMLLCRTGFRSVLVANILAKPTLICDLKEYEGDQYNQCVTKYTARGFTDVYNIWQGFVGQPMSGILTASGKRYQVGDDQDLEDLNLEDGTSVKGFVAYDLDLNNDKSISSADKDGWRYFQGLPFEVGTKPKYRNESVFKDGYYDLP